MNSTCLRTASAHGRPPRMRRCGQGPSGGVPHGVPAAQGLVPMKPASPITGHAHDLPVRPLGAPVRDQLAPLAPPPARERTVVTVDATGFVRLPGSVARDRRPGHALEPRHRLRGAVAIPSVELAAKADGVDHVQRHGHDREGAIVVLERQRLVGPPNREVAHESPARQPVADVDRAPHVLRGREGLNRGERFRPAVPAVVVVALAVVGRLAAVACRRQRVAVAVAVHDADPEFTVGLVDAEATRRAVGGAGGHRLAAIPRLTARGLAAAVSAGLPAVALVIRVALAIEQTVAVAVGQAGLGAGIGICF